MPKIFQKPKRPVAAKILLKRFVRRFLRTSMLACLFLTGILLIGLIPVNNSFRQANAGIEIFVVSNEVHADLILPIKSADHDWTEFLNSVDLKGDISQATQVAIGWGDKGFFIETPTWSDLRLATVAEAMFVPSASCLHVNFVNDERYQDIRRSIRLDEEQYSRLTEFVMSSFQTGSDGAPVQIADASYGKSDAFFEAKGSYHAFNTCNSWSGRALRTSGVRVGLYTPLPKTIYLYLPNEAKQASE